jgi:hypothetical protein
MNSKDFYLINKVTKILLKCFNASSGTGQNVEAEPQDGKIPVEVSKVLSNCINNR